MKDASQYAITQDYGYDPSYQGNAQHFHHGVDYGASEGAPALVNGAQIGLVGHTGKVYDQNGQNTVKAAHLHISRWQGGQETNPGRYQGFTIKNPVTVTTVGSDATNGNYIRLTDGDGVQWIYCHLSRQDVKQGQVLEDDMADIFNEGDRVNVNKALFGEDRGKFKSYIGSTYKKALESILGSPEFLNEQYLNPGDVVNIADAGGWPQEKGITGWLWKRMWYDYAANKVKNSDPNYVPVNEQLYKKG